MHHIFPFIRPNVIVFYALAYASFFWQKLRNSKDVRNLLCFQRKLQIRTSSPTQTLWNWKDVRIFFLSFQREIAKTTNFCNFTRIWYKMKNINTDLLREDFIWPNFSMDGAPIDNFYEIGEFTR